MADINTVSLSGVIASNVETSKSKGITVARFYIDVEGAGDSRQTGNFKIVAFANWADAAKALSQGDHVVLVGALVERRRWAVPGVEVKVRNLIPLPKPQEGAKAEDFHVEEVDDDVGGGRDEESSEEE